MRWNSAITGTDEGTIKYAEKLRELTTEKVLHAIKMHCTLCLFMHTTAEAEEAAETEAALNILDGQTAASWWLSFVRSTRIGDEFDGNAASFEIMRLAGLTA